MPIDAHDVDVNHNEARLRVKNLEIEDYGNFDNALNDTNEEEGEASFDVHWHRRFETLKIRNPAPDQMVLGDFTRTLATVKWSGKVEGFEFRSDPGSEIIQRAEIGSERNGVFFK